MLIRIANAPCSWGVDDPQNPFLPPWDKVLSEAAQAGYKSIELGPWGFLPVESEALTAALNKYQLSLVAGTIFDDLVSEENAAKLFDLTHKICQTLVSVPQAEKVHGNNVPAPYLVIIDFGDAERGRLAGQSALAPRLPEEAWQRMVRHIRDISNIARQYGVRPVIHPHAGGYIEFIDELEKITAAIPHETAGLCLDTGHIYYSGSDPLTVLERYFSRIDYLHFKDVDPRHFRHAIDNNLDFFTACAEGVMCPLGQGAIDYPGVLALLKKCAYQGWITIEQERDPRHVETSLEDVTASLHYLRSVGF
ncbi:TIM barrel protein [Erwinia sp. E_sp_B01_3]|uniref:TIM barrel protein n=1 Tax=unclassified Erwinia TaxID=2622719 RepID=UPI0030D58F10